MSSRSIGKWRKNNFQFRPRPFWDLRRERRRIDLDGDVVTGDHILSWDHQRHSPQADPDQLVHTWDDEDEPWPPSPDQSSQAEDNAPLLSRVD